MWMTGYIGKQKRVAEQAGEVLLVSEQALNACM